MEKDWSVRKKLLFWLGLIALLLVIFTVTDVFDFQPMDNLYANIVIYIIFGLFGLIGFYIVVYIAVMFPYAIMKDIKEKRKIREAKWAAYGILDEFGTVHLREGINHHNLNRLKERKKVEEITQVLSKYRYDRETSHLLYDLSELEHELKQLPDKEEDEDELEKKDYFSTLSTEELPALRDQFMSNPAAIKIIEKTALRKYLQEAEEVLNKSEQTWIDGGVSLLESLSNMQLQVLRKHHKSNQILVKMIDDVLKSRGKATDES